MANSTPPEAIAKLRRELIFLLQTTAVKAINFTLSGSAVNSSLFNSVEHRLHEWHRIKRHGGRVSVSAAKASINIRIDPTIVNDNCEALYYPDSNTLVFQHINVLSTLPGQLTALHECVHAGKDVMRTRQQSYVDEAAAYLTEYVYQFNIQQFIKPVSYVEIEAHKLASKLYKESRTKVTNLEAKPLLWVVNQTYKTTLKRTQQEMDEPYQNDGIPL